MGKTNEYVNDIYLTTIRDNMMEYIESGYDPTGFKHEWVDQVIEGVYHTRQDAGINDIPMTPAYGLQYFAAESFENGLCGNFIILSGRKKGYNYEFVFEDYDDEESGYSGMCLSLYRFVKRYPSVEVFSGSEGWVQMDTILQLDYMSSPEGKVLRLSSKGMNDIMEAYRKRYDDHGPSREKCCELYDEHKSLIDLVDRLRDITSIETRLDCKEDENFYVFTDSKNAEGMIFKDDEEGNIIPCLFFQPWYYKTDADDILIDTGYRLSPDRAEEVIREMSGHKFAFMFESGKLSYFDYDIYKERDRFLSDLQNLNLSGSAKALEEKIEEAFKAIPEWDPNFTG